MCCLRFFVTNPIMSEVSCVFSDVILFKNLLDKNKDTSIMKFCVLSSLKIYPHILQILFHLLP